MRFFTNLMDSLNTSYVADQDYSDLKWETRLHFDRTGLPQMRCERLLTLPARYATDAHEDALPAALSPCFIHRACRLLCRCYTTDNLDFHYPHLRPSEFTVHKNLTNFGSNVHMLMVGSSLSALYQRKEYLASLAFVDLQPGQVLQYYEIEGADFYSPLLREDHADEFAARVGRFTAMVEARGLSLFYNHAAAAQEVIADKAHLKLFSAFSWLYSIFLATVLIQAGLFLEICVGGFLLASEHTHEMWIAAQVLSVMMVVCAFVSGSLLTMPLMVLGTFKFGFPEVTSSLGSAFEEVNRDKPWHRRALMFTNGLGYIIHHSSGILFYGCILTHVVRATEAIGLIPLAFQHGVSFLKYTNLSFSALFVHATDDDHKTKAKALKLKHGSVKLTGSASFKHSQTGSASSFHELEETEPPQNGRHVYNAILVLLEVWFQFEVYALLPAVSLLPRFALFSLLLSHYLWFVVSLSGLFLPDVDVPPHHTWMRHLPEAQRFSFSKRLNTYRVHCTKQLAQVYTAADATAAQGDAVPQDVQSHTIQENI